MRHSEDADKVGVYGALTVNEQYRLGVAAARCAECESKVLICSCDESIRVG